MAASFRSIVESYRTVHGLPAAQALEKAQEPFPPGYAERALNAPPEEAQWWDLQHLAERDPDLAVRRWEEIKHAALEDLQTGYRAARTLEASNGTPWERAKFLALRTELTAEWEPRNGIERQLIDTMALALSSMFFWQHVLQVRASIDAKEERRAVREKACWCPPAVDAVEAEDQAAAMVDRFNRMFLRSLRALRDLRRYTPAVVVQNAGQVNVAGQQVNLPPAIGHPTRRSHTGELR
jgi:hypothetical protein